MDTVQSAEILRLHATVRDLLALSIIPETWVGREPSAIAADLADLLIGSLELGFAFVRLCDPTGRQVAGMTRGGVLGKHFRNGYNNTSPCLAEFLGRRS